MNSNKKNIYKTISVYLPKDIRRQLFFYCKLNNIGRSTLCCKLVKWFLSKKNVEQLMLDYAMEMVETDTKNKII